MMGNKFLTMYRLKSLKVLQGAIGGNGMGKSTLFSMICGDSDGGLKPSDGGIIALGESVQIGYVSQSRDSLNEQNSVYEEISGGNDYININGTEVQIRAYVSAFNLKGPAQEKRVGDLSGGERNRVHLAKTLSQGANLILLDEPTNDLDVKHVHWRKHWKFSRYFYDNFPRSLFFRSFMHSYFSI